MYTLHYWCGQEISSEFVIIIIIIVDIQIRIQ